MSDGTHQQPGFFRYSAMTIFQGFLLGIGLCAVFAIYQTWNARTYSEQFEKVSALANPASEKLEAGTDYKLEDLREIQENGGVWVVGRITNLRVNTPLRGIELQANLFKDDQFVDQYTETIYGRLRAGETRRFKISCGCKGNPPGAHDRFEVVVVSSF